MKQKEPPDSEWLFILVSIVMLAILLAVNLAHAAPPPTEESNAPAGDEEPGKPDASDEVAPATTRADMPANATTTTTTANPPTSPDPVAPVTTSADMPASPPDVPLRREIARERVVIHQAPEVKKNEDDEDPEPKLSLPTEADRQAWQRPGFRLGLSAAYGQLVGLRGAPDGALYAANLRAGLRLDSRWSITASFQYALASESGGLAGLRFAGTIDPTFHITPSWSVALGFGFGGIVEGSTSRKDAMPLPSSLENSYTFPDASTPLAKCSGVGAAALARAEYMYVIGPRMAGTIGFEVVGQWTGCVDDTGRVEPDTGNAIVRKQWWPHTGATFSVGFAWR